MNTIKKLTIILTLISYNPTYAETLFYDDFESGDMSHTENGIAYTAEPSSPASKANAKSGVYSMEFFFEGRPPGNDAWSEARMRFPATSELWISYDFYVPENYNHRSDGPSNNKFLAIYRVPYSNPGFQTNYTLIPNGSGGSNIEIHPYDNGGDGRYEPPEGVNFITEADHGKWISLIMRVKASSSDSVDDGIQQMWKNGNLVCDRKDLNMYGGVGENYMDELYLMGYSNSGYNDDTYFYIDNIKISDTPLVEKVPKNFPLSVE